MVWPTWWSPLLVGNATALGMICLNTSVMEWLPRLKLLWSDLTTLRANVNIVPWSVVGIDGGESD